MWPFFLGSVWTMSFRLSPELSSRVMEEVAEEKPDWGSAKQRLPSGGVLGAPRGDL